MAGWRRPGPLCVFGQHDVIADGTLCRQVSPKPGPVCASKSPQSSTSVRSTYQSGVKRVPLPFLRQQDHGDSVKKLQSFLNLRLDPRPPLKEDGYFGPVTRRAVVDFQTSTSIKADGEVGKTAWYHLIAGTPAKQLPTNVPAQPGMAGGATPAPKPSLPLWKPPPWSVMDWSFRKKLEYVVSKVPNILPTQLQMQFAGLMHAQSVAIKLEAMAYSELFDVGGEGGHAKIATPGGQAIFELMNPTQIAALALTQPELDKAAADLAETIKKMALPSCSANWQNALSSRLRR